MLSSIPISAKTQFVRNMKVVIFLIALAYSSTVSLACLCFTSNGVNIRSTPCGSTVIGQAGTNQCFENLGESRSCTLGGTSYTFRKFNFRGRVGWTASNYLRNGASSECSTGGGNCGNVRLVSRAEWGARAPTSITSMRTPVSLAFIHHTAGSSCSSNSACEAQVRNVQSYAMNTLGYSDISYSFLIGDDGRAYEGRGWNRRGAHTAGYNTNAIAICFMGTFTSRNPSAQALQAARDLLACGVQRGYLRPNYELFGHRDGGCTACPGNTLYRTIQSWPEFSTRSITGGCKKEDEPHFT